MPTPAQIKADLADILPLIEARLIARSVATASQIDYTLTDDLSAVPILMGDHDCWLHLKAEQPVGTFFDGSAELDVRVQRQLHVILRTRLELDEVGSARQFLRKATVGHLAFERMAFNALFNFFATDAQQNELTFGMEPLGIQEPRGLNKKGWGGSVLVFGIPYRRDVS